MATAMSDWIEDACPEAMMGMTGTVFHRDRVASGNDHGTPLATTTIFPSP